MTPGLAVPGAAQDARSMLAQWLLVLACGLLAGCATYQARPLSPERLAQRFAQRSLSAPALRIYLARQTGSELPAWPLPRWNRDMLTLAADYYSPVLAVARAQLQNARADITAAGTRPNPSLTLQLEYAANRQGPGGPYTTGPVLDIPIETAHKRAYRIEQANHLSDATELDIRSQAWRVRSRMRATLLQLHAAQGRVSLLQQQAAAQREIVRIMEKREAVGAAAAPDAFPASLALINTQAALATTQNAAQALRGELAGIIGVPIHALAGVELDLREFDQPGPPLPSADAQHAALFQRADLRAALARYAATQSALQLEIAKQYPDIHIGPGYTYDAGVNKISFGLAGITLPVFGHNRGGIAQAEAKRSEAAARIEALQDTIVNAIEQARARYLASLAAERLAATRLSTAQRQAESQAANFDAGNADRLVLSQARSIYQASALAHLDTLIAAQQAAGALEDAMQMPLSADPAAPSSPPQQSKRGLQ